MLTFSHSNLRFNNLTNNRFDHILLFLTLGADLFFHWTNRSVPNNVQCRGLNNSLNQSSYLKNKSKPKQVLAHIVNCSPVCLYTNIQNVCLYIMCVGKKGEFRYVLQNFLFFYILLFWSDLLSKSTVSLKRKKCQWLKNGSKITRMTN